MKSLLATAGVDSSVDPVSAQLVLGGDLAAEDVAVRRLDAARDVYWSPPADAAPLYHMLNGISPSAQPEPGSALRYELTSLRGGVVGRERVKTVGHVHDAASDGLGYPEAYEVVAGSAVFVLFRSLAGDRLDAAECAVQCLLVEAGVGEGFVIPPGWHHLAVNAGDEAMVFADVVARAVVPDYTLLRAHRGAPVLVCSDGLRRNPHFASGRVARLGCSELPGPGPVRRLADSFFGDRDALRYLLEPAVAVETWRAFDRLVAQAPQESLDGLEVIE